MYKTILIALDNSPLSNFGIEVGLDLARKFDSSLVGNHVYAASLHDSRFKQMEGGLPEQYKAEEKLKEQREIHDSLISKGLNVISDSFLEIFEKKCREGNVPCQKKALEGKNFKVLVEDINKSGYDLVIIGALGLGAVKRSIIGSVCERVVRRIGVDVLVIKQLKKINAGKFFVLLDGSKASFGGLKIAVKLAKEFALELELISVYDPFFHDVAFKTIVNVLSEEAADIFKFKEQERLHEEIINSGLAKIYQSYLEIGKRYCQEQGLTKIKTKLLAGKAFEEIVKYVEEEEPALVVLGRIGIHTDKGMDLGSNTENLLRLSPANLLIVSQKFTPPLELEEQEISWSKESEERIKNIPSFVRDMAKTAIKHYALTHGYSIITSDLIDQVMGSLSLDPRRGSGTAKGKSGDKSSKIPHGFKKG